MKRIVYVILVAIGCVSCDPEIYMNGGHESEWFIKNTADMPFSVSWTYNDIHEKVEIAPGDSVAIGVVCSLPSIGGPEFSLITEIVGSGDDKGLIFYSEDGMQIRHWRWSERAGSGTGGSCSMNRSGGNMSGTSSRSQNARVISM